MARFVDYIRLLNGQQVDVLVRGVNFGIDGEGVSGGLSGKLGVGEDFIVLQAEEDTMPTALRLDDIIMIQLSGPFQCSCGADHSQEETPKTEPEPEVEIDLDAMLREWERNRSDLEG